MLDNNSDMDEKPIRKLKYSVLKKYRKMLFIFLNRQVLTKWCDIVV